MSRLSFTESAALAPLARWTDLRRLRVHRGEDDALGNAVRRAVLVLSRGRACALGNRIFLPDAARDDLAVLAHEAMHCGQYQRWGALRYFVTGAAEQLRYTGWRRLGTGRNPYDWTMEARGPVETYGMEQQGQLAEDAFRGHRVARRIMGLG